ncbi:MAG TPA: hypothetical protein PKE35_14900 [Anaerolineales bacterium]|nr:hypothetical protein [Anaerolineales bacterium]
MSATIPERLIADYAAPDCPNQLRQNVTKHLTYHIAASIISKCDFPLIESLPKPFAPPFNSLGHYVLFDYKLLVKIIWQVIGEIKSSSYKVYKSILQKSLGFGALTAVSAFLLLGPTSQPEILILALLTGGLVFFIYKSYGSLKILPKTVSDIRARAIAQLVAGNWTAKPDPNIDRKIENEFKLKEIGDGIIGGKKIPIIVITNSLHPFPGYGWLQAQNVFVCKPKEQTTPSGSIHEIIEKVQENIHGKIAEFPLKEVHCGNLIAIHGDSLFMDSAWLNKDKSPHLWADMHTLKNLNSIDSRASARCYFVIQSFFPEHDTVANFFVRPFMAGNSISCQIALTTIGPLIHRNDYFQERLLQHRREQEDAPISATALPTPLLEFQNSAQKTNLLKQRIKQSSQKFRSNKMHYAEIEKLNPIETEDEQKNFSKELKELMEVTTTWPGRLTPLENWRESYSLTFTNDFFGSTEALASIKTLYQQISRTILDTFDSMGFDITDYRDREGKYSINAEKIDRLIIGQEIKILQTADARLPAKPQENSIS